MYASTYISFIVAFSNFNLYTDLGWAAGTSLMVKTTNEIADCMCHNEAWNYNSKTNNITDWKREIKKENCLHLICAPDAKKAKEKLLISPNDAPCKLRTTPSMRLRLKN